MKHQYEGRSGGMCFRCEIRASFLEDHRHRPRVECGDIEQSKASCYMYRPCKPMVLSQLDKDDPRPWPATGLLAARSYAERVYDDGILMVKGIDEGMYVLVWRVPAKGNNKPVCIDG